MDIEDTLPVFAVAALAIALKAVFDARRLRRRLSALVENFLLLNQRVARLSERLDQGTPAAAEVVPPPVTETPAEPTAAQPPELKPEPAQAAPPSVLQPAAAEGRRWEQVLVEHWLVWLGGATLALGGVFLVKLSIDYGLMTPLVRVVLGALLGVALSVGAEWVKRHDPLQAGEAGGASYVPQALAAAGAATVFASLYAAYALYGLIPGGVAFVLLAATAGAAVAQSLRQGPLVAALGLVGAFAVPALVSSANPSAVPLFLYLAVVTAGSLAVLRHRAWLWLALLALAGAIGWALLWLAGADDPETPVVGLYLLIQFALFVAFRHGIARVAFLAGMIDTPIVRGVVRAALWAIALAVLALGQADKFGTTTLAVALLATIGMMVLAYRDSRLDDAVTIAGTLALTLLASWALPLPVSEMALAVFRVQPDHLADFITAAILFTLLLGLGSFVLLPRVARPGRWAAPSAAVPLVVLVIAYWRLQKFELDIAWSLASLALAGLNLGAAASVAQRRDGAIENEIALASYAVAVLGGTIFAATLALGEAWLTVALALHLPAMGWIERRIRLPALRWLALGVAATVLIRLIINPYVLSYPIGNTPIFNWLLYGYGVPAASFIAATKMFGRDKDDALVCVLEAGSAVFSLALLSLELIHATYGRLTNFPLDDFGAGASLIALWLAFAAVLLALGEYRQRPVLRWGGRLVLGMATSTALVWQPVMLLFGVDVGNLAIFDALLFADMAPAVIYAAIAWLNPSRRILRTITRVLAAMYAFAWISLEIRHIFQGRVELFASSGEAEWYTYSVAWLLFAGMGLGLGLLRRNAWLRQAGLIGIGLVIAKVFLSDMAELSGVLRALSFIGLGAALIGIGYAYRRLHPLQPAS